MLVAGRKRRALSDGIRAQVSGKPQVLGYRTDEMVWAPRDSDAILDIIFCSNPKYKNVYWEWGEIPNIIQMREGKKEGIQIILKNSTAQTIREILIS